MIICKLFGYRAAEMMGHKDGKIEPRSKAKHDHHAFERHKKAKQDTPHRFSQ
jgi:hypothetical protein